MNKTSGWGSLQLEGNPGPGTPPRLFRSWGSLAPQPSGGFGRQPVCVIFPLISSFDTQLEPYSCASC